MTVSIATLTLVSTTPYSAQLRFDANASGIGAYLLKSGATGGNVDLSTFHAGPLRACLERSSNWNSLGDRIIVRLTLDGCHSGSVYNQAFSYIADGVYGAPGALSATGQWLGDRAWFLSGPGPVQCTFEIRYVHAAYR